MSVLAIINTQNGSATKSGLEVASYATGLAAQLGTDAVGIVAGPMSSADAIGATGIKRTLHHEGAVQDSGQWAKLAAAAAVATGPRMSCAAMTILDARWPPGLPFA